jgi:hypothetical protein
VFGVSAWAIALVAAAFALTIFLVIYLYPRD